MPGPAPSRTRRRRNEPARGEWKPSKPEGWQHGDVPKPPAGLLKASREAWATWFGSWFASHWGPEDLPMLRQLIRQYDLVERGDGKSADRAELRQLADNFGITKKGQQDRRWAPPFQGDVQGEPEPTTEPPAAPESPYGHLRAV